MSRRANASVAAGSRSVGGSPTLRTGHPRGQLGESGCLGLCAVAVPVLLQPLPNPGFRALQRVRDLPDAHPEIEADEDALELAVREWNSKQK